MKNKQNLEKLWEKVNEYVNKNLVKLPINSLVEKMGCENETAISLISAEGNINIALLGDSGTGKSNLFSRYFTNTFHLDFISTIGMDKQTKIIIFKNHLYRISISDTAGQERFRSLPLKYYKNADGAILLFDITDKNSFVNINSWMADLKGNAGNGKQVIYIVGNKIDLPERKVTQEEGTDLANSYGLKYYEMSCKININVYEILSRLIIDCINKLQLGNEEGFKLKRKKTKSKNKKSKC